jgi:hypothetical protein
MGRYSSLLSLLFLFLMTPAVFSKDHAGLSEGHETFAQDFIAQELKSNDTYDPQKIGRFIGRLEKEKQSILQDSYETSLIESLELETKSFKSAKKDALKDADEKKNKMAKAYTDYLIPKMKELQLLVQDKKEENRWDELVSDFINGYMPFYIPNQLRTFMVQDINPGTVGYHFFNPYVIKKDSEKRVEAFNLMVDQDSLTSVQQCLKTDVQVGHYLNNDELETLKSCAFDISLLNPGKSALWKKMQEEDFVALKKGRPELFPKESDRLTFEQVKISGIGSPKLEANFKRGDKEIEVKVKMGQEVHTDYLGSLVGKYLGFNQDLLEYRSQVRIYLGKTTFQEFSTQYINKYGQPSFMRYIYAHGNDGGEEWIDLKDVSLEVKIPDESGYAQLNIDGWDLRNRREYRAMLLWYAWFNINDTRYDNFKTILKKTPQGKLEVLHRFQDPGYSLGSNLVFKNVLGLSRLGQGVDKYLVNLYDASIINWNEDKSSVQIWWNDFANQNLRFKTTTWYDLKWMARNIAKIKEEDLAYALKSSGMPAPVADLYFQKMKNRRNEMVKAFDLQDEFPLYEVPQLSNYSPNKHIKNGVLVESNFEGHHEYVASTNGIVNLIGGFTNLQFPFGDMARSFQRTINGILGNNNFENDATVATIGGNPSFVNPGTNPISMTMLSPGVAFNLGRTVGVNAQIGKVGEEAKPYFVKDKLIIEINFTANIFSFITSFLPVNAGASLKLYRKEFEFIHHATSIAEAYKSPFKLFFALASAKYYAAFKMEPLEVIKISDSYGFELAGRVGAMNNIPILTNEVSGGIGWRKTSPIYFTRDQFGALHLYKEKVSESYQQFNLQLLNVNLATISLPIIGLDFAHKKFFYHGTDYSFKLPAYSQGTNMVDQLQRQKDYDALMELMNDSSKDDQEPLSAQVRKNFDLKASGMKKKFNLGFLFYFREHREQGNSKAMVVTPDGKERVFYRYFLEEGEDTGIPMDALESIRDILVKKGTTSKIVIEMDGKNPDQLVGMIRNIDYHAKRTHDQLENFIQNLNGKYSVEKELKFYRDYVLPDKSALNLYRRVYGSSRIFVNGKGLLDKVKKTTPEEMSKLIHKYYTKAIFKGKNSKNIFTQIGNTFNRKAKVDRLMRSYSQLQRLADKADRMPRTLVAAIANFLALTNTDDYGVGFLKELLGPEHLYVMGEIFGIYRGFTDLQKAEPLAGRRFAGKSWGTYSVVPPIQKFLRDQTLMTPSHFIAPAISSEDIFGELPNGMSPMEDLSL